MKTAFMATIVGIGLCAMSGCYFQSDTQLIAAEDAIDPFGDAEFYLIHQTTDDEHGILTKMPDNSFRDYTEDSEQIESVYRFMMFDDDAYMPQSDKFLTTLCSIAPEDGCYIVLTTSTDRRHFQVMLPEPPTDDSENRTFGSADAAIEAISEAVIEGLITTQSYDLITPMTRAEADAWLASRHASSSTSDEP